MVLASVLCMHALLAWLLVTLFFYLLLSPLCYYLDLPITLCFRIPRISILLTVFWATITSRLWNQFSVHSSLNWESCPQNYSLSLDGALWCLVSLRTILDWVGHMNELSFGVAKCANNFIIPSSTQWTSSTRLLFGFQVERSCIASMSRC